MSKPGSHVGTPRFLINVKLRHFAIRDMLHVKRSKALIAKGG
ncbi:hypothetical protein SF06_23590 [Pseudomonas flexibilis]|nr:hypothetical protein SF06_23590 [Pseudomonas flexibilis]